MSHITAIKTVKGKPLITRLDAVRTAAEHLGLEVVETNKYRWYGHHVGDWAIPQGFKQSEMGTNATCVLRVTDPKRSQLRAKYGQDPYDLAIVPDPLNEGCYTIMYDFYNKGYGLDEIVGSPKVESQKDAAMLAPRFMQHYHMACAALAAREQGDDISFQEQQDGSWTAEVDTKQRIGV